MLHRVLAVLVQPLGLPPSYVQIREALVQTRPEAFKARVKGVCIAVLLSYSAIHIVTYLPTNKVRQRVDDRVGTKLASEPTKFVTHRGCWSYICWYVQASCAKPYGSRQSRLKQSLRVGSQEAVEGEVFIRVKSGVEDVFCIGAGHG